MRLRSAAEKLVHVQDRTEFQKTKYVLNAGAQEFLRLVAIAIMRQPFATIKMIKLALRMGWRSDRGLLRHLAYAGEAIILADWCRRDDVQHLHAHFGTNSAAVAMLSGVLSKIPYSFTAHGSEEFEKAPLLSLELKLSHAAFAVCVSSFGRAQLMRWTPPDLWHKITVVHCGVDSSFFNSIRLLFRRRRALSVWAD